MVAEIQGFKLGQTTYVGQISLIKRAIRDSDQMPVIIKLLNIEHPSIEQVASFKHEFEITQKLKIPEVISAYSLEKVGHTYAIVEEQLTAPTLAEILHKKNKFNIKDFLKIAITLSTILDKIHQRNIIHKDLNPQNIYCDIQNNIIKIGDFGIAVNLSKEKPIIVNANVLEGTLAYIAPEQTGRMNRGIDYRSDYYSLGVIFYQMLTGKLPFATTDPLELIHCHIAIKPKTPHEIDETISEAISEITMKLIAKNAEERYQSMHGLIKDLEECQLQLQTTNQIKPFASGKHDIHSHFQISEKLYGREDEARILLDMHQRSLKGQMELVLIAGLPGIGKTTLVQEIYRPLSGTKGYFISGKYDQLKHNTPYSALIQAFDDLIRQFLTESETRILSLKQKILKAVKENGQIIIDVIPALEAIIGKQPPVTKLSPTATQNRFFYVTQEFLKVLSDDKHPLVIFLDDLQWTDMASIKLLSNILSNPEFHYLFIIGSYRSNEVDVSHPLKMMLSELDKKNITCKTVTLNPLSLEKVNELIADTLSHHKSTTANLAEICYQKTGGNPFFLTQILQILYRDNLIKFNKKENRWDWDIKKIKNKSVTENIVDLLIDKISELPREVQNILQVASCIGNKFSVHDVAEISKLGSIEEINLYLQDATQEGYIFPLNRSYYSTIYQFSHDKVQQAVYSLAPENKKIDIHLQIARKLWKENSGEHLNEFIFRIVDHFNFCQAHINSSSLIPANEKQEIANLNLIAATLAYQAAAFDPALKYAEFGINYLDKSIWRQNYTLIFELNVLAAQNAFLLSQYDLMNHYLEIGLANAENKIDKLRIYEIKLSFLNSQLKHTEALNLIYDIFAGVGLRLPKRFVKLYVFWNILRIKRMLKKQDIMTLFNRTDEVDPTIKMIMKLLGSCLATSYQSFPSLFPVFACLGTRLSLLHGNCSGSAMSYSCFGFIIISAFNDIDIAYELSNLSLKLIEKHPDEKTISIFANYSFVRYWKERFQDTLPPLEENFEHGLNSGDVEFACYSINFYFRTAWLYVPPLNETIEKIERYAARVKNLKNVNSWRFLSIVHQTMLNLAIPGDHPEILTGSACNEAEIIDVLTRLNIRSIIFTFYNYKFIISCLFENHDTAKIYYTKCKEYYSPQVISFYFIFYQTLFLLSCYKNSTFVERWKLMKTVKANMKKIRYWAKKAPMNQLHHYHLIQAELARVKGDFEKASKHYEKSIKLAKQNDFICDEAFANELAAKFYLNWKMENIAKIYMQEAWHCYKIWGANAKAIQLEKRYPDLIKAIVKTPDTLTTSHSSSQLSSSNLDLVSFQKASQAISSTIILEELLKNLIKVILENAGAEDCYLLLEKKEQFFIEAHGNTSGEVSVMESKEIGSEQLPLNIINYVIHAKESVVLGNAANEGAYTYDPYVQKKHLKSALCMPLINQGKLSGVLYMQNNLTDAAFTADRIATLNLLSSQMAISIDNARLYDEIKILNIVYEKFVPHEFLNLLEKDSILDVKLGDQIQKDMTVMFTDIRNFTSLSEKMTPQETFAFINAFLKQLEPLIFKYHGFIDKYQGDAIMALYPTKADDAIKCAIEMLITLKLYNERYRADQHPIRIGIGLNSGKLMLGTVGGAHHMEGTVLSDAVNIASRVESLTKIYGVRLLITEDTRASLQNPGLYLLRNIGTVLVKGKTRSITVYEVFDTDPESIQVLKQQTIKEFEQGILLFNQERYSEALPIFQEILKLNEDDVPAASLVEQCKEFLKKKNDI